MHPIPGHETLCGFENPPGAMFCGSCGAPLYAVCGRCGTEVPGGFSFCTACGNRLATPQHKVAEAEPTPVGPQPSEPEPGPSGRVSSERRLVSVLFCDLVDFTGLAESLDPEEVRDLLTRYFEAARSVVARHGGAIEKFIGDAVVAIWGSPVAHEDDAERAVRSALEIVAAVHELPPAGGSQPLQARAAVATGESAVMLGREGEGMVAGDIVNTAARLQTAAEPGSVMMNDATRLATAHSIVARPAGKQRLKGKSAPVHSWRAIRPVGPGAKRAPDPPLIGRDRELKELSAAFGTARRTRRSRLVSVIGVPGVGKTQLVRELGRRVTDRQDVVVWLAARTPWSGAGTAFAPLAEMVRRQLRIAEGEASEVGRRKLASALTELTDDEEERAWLTPRLMVLLDPDEEGRHEREELFAAWSRLFELVAERSAVGMVFDDAHRADPGLLDFITYLVEGARDLPLLAMTLARPDLLELRPHWGAGLRSFSSLHLEKLSDADVRRLLQDLAPGLATRATSEVVRRADGVPLYAVEMARMLQDARGRGATALAPSPNGNGLLADGAEVPTSLHALIAARIDAVPEPERGLLLSASVLGRQFSRQALAAVAEAEPGLLDEGLNRLERREILAPADDARQRTRGQLKFTEQLVQDVAYRTLARGERRKRHLRAADYLEGIADEELVEAVANHLVRAYQADPRHPQAASLAERARPALERAARRARALGAPDRALTHLQDGLAMAENEAERAPLMEQAAAAAQAAGRVEVAERSWRELIQLQSRRGDRAGAARATARLAGLLLLVLRNDAALTEVEAALDMLGQADADEPAGVELAGQLARAHMLRGATSEAGSWAERALSGAERLGLSEVAIDALITRGFVRGVTGDQVAGLADLNEAITQCSANDLLALELRARNNVAWLLVSDDPRQTLEAARTGYQIGHQKGMRDMALQLGSVAFVTAIETGDWDWALRTIDDLEEEPISPANRIDLAATATILRALKGVTRPDQPLAKLKPLPADIDPQIGAQVDYARAWIAFAQGRYERASTAARDAANGAIGYSRHTALVLAGRAALWSHNRDGLSAVVDAIHREGVEGRAATAGQRTLEAAAAALDGEREKARSAYRAAISAWRELDLPLPLLLTLCERDALLDPPKGDTEDEAARLVERLGAKGLKRLVSP